MNNIPQLLSETSLLNASNRAADLGLTEKGPAPKSTTTTVGETKRLQRLNDQAAAQKAQVLSLSADRTDRVQRTQLEVLQDIAHERVIGKDDLRDVNFFELAIAVSRGVGRIVLPNGYGTGFLIGPNIMLTNNHVIQDEAEATSAQFQLDYQNNAEGVPLPVRSFRIRPDLFFVTNADLDFTMVGLEEKSKDGIPIHSYPWVKLIADKGKAIEGSCVNIIQHPNGGLKQVAIRSNEVVRLNEHQLEFLYYTTDTEPGSSGSPCFNDQWEVVALHHMGVPQKDDKGKLLQKDGRTIWKDGDHPSLLNWIANEGVRISAIVKHLKAVQLPDASWQAVQHGLLNGTPPNPIELARNFNTSAKVVGNDVSNDKQQAAKTISDMTLDKPAVINIQDSSSGVQVTIPLTISVSLGNPRTANGSPANSLDTSSQRTTGQPATDRSASGIGDTQHEVTINNRWEARKGYDPKFLGFDIPLPELTTTQKANTVEVPERYRVAGNKYAFPYFHYSVAMNKKRRTAWYSAAMIDGNNFFDFKRGKDKWFLDPRFDAKFQMGEELYADANTDRGHLTRFKDLSWGKTKAEALDATNDSFHFTNCALQLDVFNQGKSRWQGLELFLLEQHAKKDERKMVVMTGPTLKDTDPQYRNSRMKYAAKIPLAFWKICCLKREDGTLAATAFILSQSDITKLKGFEEKFDIGVAQITIAELQKMIGLKFGTLSAHDHFANHGAPGTLEMATIDDEMRLIKPIESFQDIII